MTEERRGFTFVGPWIGAGVVEGETEWLTLTELQARMSGAPNERVMAVWDVGDRARELLSVLLTINVKDKATITVYESPYGDIVLGGIGWHERLEWEKKSETKEG